MNMGLIVARFKKIQGFAAGYFAVLMLVDQYLHLNQSFIYVLGVISVFLLVVCTVMSLIILKNLNGGQENFKSKHALYFILFNAVAIYSVYANCL